MSSIGPLFKSLVDGHFTYEPLHKRIFPISTRSHALKLMLKDPSPTHPPIHWTIAMNNVIDSNSVPLKHVWKERIGKIKVKTELSFADIPFIATSSTENVIQKMKECSTMSRVDLAEQLFHLHLKSCPEKPSLLFACLLRVYGENNMTNRVDSVLDKMENLNVPVDAHVLSGIITTCRKSNDLEYALDIYHRMLHCTPPNVQPCVMASNQMIQLAFMQSQPDMSLISQVIHHLLCGSGDVPLFSLPHETVRTLVKHSQDFDQLKSWMEQLAKINCLHQPQVQNALFRSLEFLKFGSSSHSLQNAIMFQLQRLNVPTSPTTLEYMVRCCIRTKSHSSLMSILDTIHTNDDYLYSIALALKRCHHPRIIQFIFQQILDRKLFDVDLFKLLLSAIVRTRAYTCLDVMHRFILEKDSEYIESFLKLKYPLEFNLHSAHKAEIEFELIKGMAELSVHEGYRSFVSQSGTSKAQTCLSSLIQHYLSRHSVMGFSNEQFKSSLSHLVQTLKLKHPWNDESLFLLGMSMILDHLRKGNDVIDAVKLLEKIE